MGNVGWAYAIRPYIPTGNGSRERHGAARPIPRPRRTLTPQHWGAGGAFLATNNASRPLESTLAALAGRV